jgi:predicted ATPase/class 3 adenylate cyclase
MVDAAARAPRRPDLPTGTVTFLFTDIEGSTRLLQLLDERYRDMLGMHDAVMRRAILGHGGIEVNTEGDSFFAVFASARSAVAAVVSAQRELSASDWPEGASVRVRMGLHTGEGVPGGTDYLGLDVHRAARVAAAAHGGQVLVSEATRAALGASPVDGVTFEALGGFRLKDLDRPLRLHQLAAEGLAREFPPPRARRLGTLPSPRTSFVGRASSLAQLRELRTGTRLLLLTGPGGVGKTRLALELARSVADEHEDGAFFVPLEAIADARLVSSAILQALDVPPGTRSPEEALREALAGLQVLLVLDNLEQIPGMGAKLDDLLQAAPGLTVVGTSRNALRVYGEQEYPVPPLELPAPGQAQDPALVEGFDGIDLFVARARASRPDFRLSEANAGTVAEICRRLDGLPLAIELAAARIRMLSPEAILTRLDRRLKLLEDNAPNLPPRQRSLRGAIEWSYSLLGDVEQRLLSRLGIFVGGWDLSSAEAVCDPDGDLGTDLLEGIGSLLDKSLVDRREGAAETRFAMLQTIHEYAREQLALRGELETSSRRHADHFRGVVEAAEPQFLGSDPGACVSRLAPDLDNIRAALAWCLEADEADTGLAIAAAGWRLWQSLGQLTEGRRTLDAMLALPSAAEPTALRARALTAAGGILYWQGDPASRVRYQEALAIHERLGDDAGVADSLNNLGFSALTAAPPDPELARSYFAESLRHAEALGDARLVASLVGSLGFSAMLLGDLEEARERLERALSLNLAGGFRGRAADNRFALGTVHRMSGRLREAAEMYRVALAEAVEMQDDGRKTTVLSAVAIWAATEGHTREAVRIVSVVRRAARQQGGNLARAAGLTDPVAVAREQGLGEDAIAGELEAGERLTTDLAVGFAITVLEQYLADGQERRAHDG